MNEEQQIRELEVRIAERERRKELARKQERRRAFWIGNVAPVLGLLFLVMLAIMIFGR
jgi:hypothetical protein